MVSYPSNHPALGYLGALRCGIGTHAVFIAPREEHLELPQYCCLERYMGTLYFSRMNLKKAMQILWRVEHCPVAVRLFGERTESALTVSFL